VQEPATEYGPASQDDDAEMSFYGECIDFGAGSAISGIVIQPSRVEVLAVLRPHNLQQAAARQHRGTLEGLRVLLVEDSWIVGSSLKSMLELLGANVIGPAASLGDATALANSSRYDVAVMDLDLQGELADKLICTVHWRGVPVVVVTGYELPPAIADKVLTVIPKPINAGALLTKLREVNTARLAPRRPFRPPAWRRP